MVLHVKYQYISKNNVDTIDTYINIFLENIHNNISIKNINIHIYAQIQYFLKR